MPAPAPWSAGRKSVQAPFVDPVVLVDVPATRRR